MDTLRNSLLRLLMLIIAIVMLFPFLWMVSGAFKSHELILQYPPVWIPPTLNFENFIKVLTTVPLWRYMVNSLIVVSTVTISGLLFHSMAGYALACMRFRGRNSLFMGILSTMMIPFYSILIPLFLIIKQLGWINTYWGLIIPMIPHAFGIFLFRQFYLTFPKDLLDAAKIDGCSEFRTFFRIVLPLSKPILAALGIVFFISVWDKFLWPLIVTSNSEMWVLPLGISQFRGQYVQSWELLMAGAVIASIPTILVFIVLQNKIIEGIKITGIKG